MLTILAIVLLIIVLILVHFINILWLAPKKLEKSLRDQGFKGNVYRPIHGDLSEITSQAQSVLSKPISPFSHDIMPRLLPFVYQTVEQYGKDSFMWHGKKPRLNITKPEFIREILTKYKVYCKRPPGQKSPFGLVLREGEDWAKVRRIINPAFHMDKLKNMLPTMELCCEKMINKWEEMAASSGGSVEVDVYTSLSNLSGDVIARTAFGSSYEEGTRLFELQQESVRLAFQSMRSIFNYIPGWRFVPSKTNRRRKMLGSKSRDIVKKLVENRIIYRSTQGEGNKYKNDLLSIMLESNEKEIEENGRGMSMEDVIDECKLFFLAGKDTVASLLTWTMVLLSQHQDWQSKARDEIMTHIGKDKSPDFEGLHSLKIVNMIMNETLRFYPPVGSISRMIPQHTNLKHLSLEHDMELNLPMILVQRDPELWGDDANEFNPSRFSDGVLKASKVPGSFIPFGGGPRVCVGQNFALIEAKLALTKILQNFTFELSPSYVHAPMSLSAMVPQFGAPLILHKI